MILGKCRFIKGHPIDLRRPQESPGARRLFFCALLYLSLKQTVLKLIFVPPKIQNTAPLFSPQAISEQCRMFINLKESLSCKSYHQSQESQCWILLQYSYTSQCLALFDTNALLSILSLQDCNLWCCSFLIA